MVAESSNYKVNCGTFWSANGRTELEQSHPRMKIILSFRGLELAGNVVWQCVVSILDDLGAVELDHANRFASTF